MKGFGAVKLTAAAIRDLALPPGKTEAIFFDDELGGFGLRLRDGATPRWVYQYKIGERNRRITLGSLAALTPAQARKTAGDLHAMVRLGRDPAAEKAESRAAAAETVGAVVTSYLVHQKAALRPGSYAKVEHHLLKHCAPLHGLGLAKIDRRAVAGCVGAIATASGNVAANRTRASLSACFTWAIQEGLAEQNPVIGTARKPEQARDRVLSLAELCAIWRALGDDQYGRIIKLLILTAQRASEIGGLQWSEVTDTEITLPGVRTKNKHRHIVPLSEPARALLNAPPRGDYVFGRDIGRPFSGWSRCKERLDARIAEMTGAPIPAWIVHDIRRAVATHLAETGVQPHVVEAILNHISGTKAGVAGIYNRASYEREKRQALDLWAEHLLAAVEERNSNIVTLVRA